jgi:hypothetical protein
VLNEMAKPEASRGTPFAFEIVSEPQAPIANLDKRGLSGEPSSAADRRLMMEGVMAKVIEFYVSDSLPKRANYIARKERGKLIEFRSPKRNQVNSTSAQWPGMVWCILHHSPQAL